MAAASACSSASGAAPKKAPKLETESVERRYVDRMPKFKKTGNEIEDTKLDAEYVQLQTFLYACFTDHTHIAPLYGMYLRRDQATNKVATARGGKVLPSIKTVKDISLEIWGAFVLRHSSFTTAELQIIRDRGNKDGPRQLGMYGTQLKPSLKIPDGARVEQVIHILLDNMHVEFGRRLDGVRAMLKFNVQEGILNWSCGCYFPTFDKEPPHLLCTVKHVPTGDEVDIDASDTIITCAFKLINNFSDADAAFKHKIVKAPIKLYDLFENGIGPKKAKLHKTAADFDVPCAIALQAWSDQSNAKDDTQACKTTFAMSDKAANQVKMKKAREKAQEVLKAKRLKLEIDVSKNLSA